MTATTEESAPSPTEITLELGGLSRSQLGDIADSAHRLADQRAEPAHSAVHEFWDKLSEAVHDEARAAPLDSADAAEPATGPPAPPTHQDVLDAVRARIIGDCSGPHGGCDPSDAELAALVTAYNGTDARESVDIHERVSAALGRPEWDKDVNTAAEMAQVVALALVGGPR